MRPKRIGRHVVALLGVLGFGIGGGCSDMQPVGSPVSAPYGVRADVLFPTDGAGHEYEPDTGELACPAILNSHVKYWVNINAVGPRLFTFFAPHVRTGYLGGGVYRYRMTIGKSDDGEWMAEGSWTGKCIGYGQWGIGKVLSFDGTVWRVDDDLACGGSGGGGGVGTELVETAYDPYSAYETSVSDCPSDEGGDHEGGTQYEPGDYTGGETVDWRTGIGNGGASACGKDARVEFVCIDIYNPATGRWEEMDCGFVTTC